jgi:hypothetical protein
MRTVITMLSHGVAASAQDRELWAVDGQPSGEALLRAAAGVADGLAERARPYVDGEAG